MSNVGLVVPNRLRQNMVLETWSELLCGDVEIGSKRDDLSALPTVFAESGDVSLLLA